MKRTTWKIAWALSVFVACSLALSGAGCKKNQEPPKAQTPEEGILQLRVALGTASPAVQKLYYEDVEQGIRYGKPLDAMVALDKIANDPSLNDQQKKAVSNVLELLKQSVQNQQKPAVPAQ
jgi:hypothetical protein